MSHYSMLRNDRVRSSEYELLGRFGKVNANIMFTVPENIGRSLFELLVTRYPCTMSRYSKEGQSVGWTGHATRYIHGSTGQEKREPLCLLTDLGQLLQIKKHSDRHPPSCKQPFMRYHSVPYKAKPRSFANHLPQQPLYSPTRVQEALC